MTNLQANEKGMTSKPMNFTEFHADQQEMIKSLYPSIEAEKYSWYFNYTTGIWRATTRTS